MPQLTSPHVQLSMESYLQLVDVIKTFNLHLKFTCKYNLTTNSRDLISNMPTARYLSLVAVLSTNEMMVVGGTTFYFNKKIANVESACFSPS